MTTGQKLDVTNGGDSKSDLDQTLSVERLLPSKNPDPNDRKIAWGIWWEVLENRRRIVKFLYYIAKQYPELSITDDDIEDVIQDTVVTARQRMEAGKYQVIPGKPLTGWVKKIALNLTRRRMRLKFSQIPFDNLESMLSVSAETVEDQLTQQELLEQVIGQARTFKMIDQEILWKYFWEGLSYEEIARQHGMTVEAVRQRKSRVVRELKRFFK